MKGVLRLVAGAGIAALAGLTILVGLAIASSSTSSSRSSNGGAQLRGGPFSGDAAAEATATQTPQNSGGMMGGSMGQSMMGGAGIDAMGQMMGSALANQSIQRLSVAEAQTLGNASPPGATIDSASNTITFQTANVQFAVLASPDNGPDMTFRIAGLADPTIVVPQGATVTVQFVEADKDTSHGWLLTAAQPPFSAMTMMDAPAAFSGSSAMPLGDPTSAGLQSETITFTASAAGQYTYLCPVPGHAQKGMHGAFVVAS